MDAYRRRHARLQCLLTVSIIVFENLPNEEPGGQQRQLTATSKLSSPHESAFVFEGGGKNSQSIRKIEL